MSRKRRWLPPLIAGQDRACFAVTEPDSGLNTLKLKTRAVRQGDHYVVHGQKVWICTAQVANKVLLLARTTPVEDAQGDRGPEPVLHRPRPPHDRGARDREDGPQGVDSNQVFIDGLRIPVDDRIGEEGKGFSYILHGLNPERILIASEAVGLGRAALQRGAPATRRSARCSSRPIGQNQAIQHPLAQFMDGARGGAPDGAEGRVAVRPGSAVRRRGQQREVSSPPRPATARARTRSSRTAAWATPRSTTWSATCARRGSRGWRR